MVNWLLTGNSSINYVDTPSSMFYLGWSEWMKELVIIAYDHFFSYIMTRTSYIRWYVDIRFVLDQHAWLDFKCVSSRVDMSLHSDTLSWLCANQSLLFLLNNTVCCNFMVIDLTRPELELTIYHTRGEHSNHFISDVVHPVRSLCTNHIP
jgi:hypothetical protein